MMTEHELYRNLYQAYSTSNHPAPAEEAKHIIHMVSMNHRYKKKDTELILPDGREMTIQLLPPYNGQHQYDKNMYNIAVKTGVFPNQSPTYSENVVTNINDIKPFDTWKDDKLLLLTK